MTTEYRSYPAAGVNLGYLFAAPAAETPKPAPLLVFLHGRREGGNDLGKLLATGLPKYVEAARQLPYYFIAPQIPEGSTWRDAAVDVLGLMDAISAVLPIDRTQVTLAGVCMGATGAWELATAHPQRFARLAIFSGSVPDAIGAARLDELKNTQVWIFQGARDVLAPPASAEQTVAALRAHGVPVTYTLLADTEHVIADAVFSNAALQKWLAGRG